MCGEYILFLKVVMSLYDYAVLTRIDVLNVKIFLIDSRYETKEDIKD
jgi:hypothetical protein